LRYCRAATIILAPRPLKSHPDCRRLPIQIVALHIGKAMPLDVMILQKG
jgi:hypothetical protein